METPERMPDGKDNRKDLRISVRNLVEFVLRSGDLDNRRTAGAKREAMQAGSRLHRKIQRRMGADYRAEVPLKHRVSEDEFTLLVEGRADGIIERDGQVTIDEIKCVYADVNRFKEPDPVHMAQAMCYGHFCCADRGLLEVGVQVTYCNIESEEIRRFECLKTADELEQWFSGLIHEYVKWARYLYVNGLRRDESLRELQFPFPYREGQRELAVSVYRTVSREKVLFIQAATGIGKTMSTLFPAVKAMGEGLAEKVFYLTAKTITRSVAEEAFAILRERGLYMRTVTITSKEKLCVLDKPECNPDACPRAKGHFDRVNDAVYEIIHREAGITREIVLAYAKEHNVCPFEFCLDISNWVDGIICDYNYVFDPNVRLKRYFAEGQTGDYLFLVDEAHNLVPRAREMYSAELIKEEVLEARRIVKERSPRLSRALEQVNKHLLALKRECEDFQILPDVSVLALGLMKALGEMDKFLDDHREFEGRETVLDFYFSMRNFMDIYERLDDHYKIYSQMLPDGKFMVRLFCVNPAANLKQCMEQGRSTVFFSATMLPVRYYRELLSGGEEDYAVYVASPFPRENRAVYVASDVSSLYSRRNEREYDRVIAYIRAAMEARRGNYMVFFPSYQYMRDVTDRLETLGGGIHYMCQSSRMTETEREEFLEEFSREHEESMAAFCVMGGLFSEGIDLTEEKLIGAIVVGTGLPMVCTEQTILKDYFEEKESQGFDFAYRYPGMNKVMQAGGRVIRTAADRGIILLLDDRFLRNDYQALFPREWQDYQVVNVRNVREKIEAFWSRTGREESL